MSILATFDKQPAEVQDYDIDFNPYLSALGDTGSSITVTADAGLDILQTGLTDGVAKVWVGGGADRQKYKITVRLLTAAGRVREADIVVRVKEV